MKYKEFKMFKHYTLPRLSALAATMGGRWTDHLVQLLDAHDKERNEEVELVRCARLALYKELADEIGKMPFGDTAASFAAWIRAKHDAESLSGPHEAEGLQPRAVASKSVR